MILINTDNKLSDKTTLKNVVILLPDVFADDNMFFPQVFFRSCIIWSINRIQSTLKRYKERIDTRSMTSYKMVG